MQKLISALLFAVMTLSAAAASPKLASEQIFDDIDFYDTSLTVMSVEKKDKTKPDSEWIVITSTLRHCKYSVTKLIEGKEYLFRVRAENRLGPGPPCVSKPLLAKDPFGKVLLAS